jgi:ubiquinone/menaquinone biosynthesis C-methylase UbiE
MRYSYGTSDAAAKRLELLSGLFNPYSEAFIKNYCPGNVESVLDLGCGPGFTTDMLIRAAGCNKVCGLDSSENLLALASKQFPQHSFIRHNVIETPFPVQAPIIYARFLLTHLKDIVSLVNRWVKELPLNGMLLIEECEAIDTQIPVFREYIKVASDLIASAGGFLYAGKILSQGAYEAEVLCNEVISIPASNSTVAAWFYINTTTLWEREQYVLDTTSPEKRKRISNEILKIRDSGDMATGSTWKLRRIVLRKHG